MLKHAGEEEIVRLAQKKADEEGVAYLVCKNTTSPIHKDGHRLPYCVKEEDSLPEDRNGQEVVVHPSGARAPDAKLNALAGTNGHAAPWGRRRELTPFRGGHTQKLRVGGQTFYLRTGEYEDGTLGEIFIDAGKQQEFLRCALNWLAIVTSLALQHGTPLDELVEAMVGEWGGPAGPVQLHAEIKQARSVADLIFRHLGMHYLGLDQHGKAKEEVKP